eukprot:XP_014788831.1 PREDICTED: uncharacterized protein LOC106882606 isoform X2 [Octopus bimaculoides]
MTRISTKVFAVFGIIVAIFLFQYATSVFQSTLFSSPSSIQPRDNLSSTEKAFSSIQSNLSINTAKLTNDITVLTAYFNIGAFAKGSLGNIFTPNRKKYF